MKTLCTSQAGLLVALASLTPALRADTLIVPDGFPTIQAAITAAVEGDEIVIKAGVYTETALQANAKAGLVIRGQGKVVIRPAVVVDGIGLSVTGGSGIILENLVFEYGHTGFRADGVAGLELRQCTFTKCGDLSQSTTGDAGCAISSIAAATVVEDCSFEQCDAAALHVSGPGQEGATLSIRDNVFETLDDGILLFGLDQAHVSGNSVRCIGFTHPTLTIQNFSFTIDVGNCTSENVILEGNFLRGGRGLRVAGCDEIIVFGNQITDTAFDGILLDSSTAVRVEGNTITNAGFGGIDVHDDCTSLVILDNVVKKARNVGMSIDGSGHLCKGNRIEQSRFDGLIVVGDDNTFLENVILKSGRLGLTLTALAESNTLTGNVVTGSKVYDLRDQSGGANLLTDNTIGTTAP